MKFFTAIFVFLMTLSTQQVIGQALNVKSSRDEKDRAELTKLTFDISRTSVQKDAATLERLMHKDFVMLGVSDRYFRKQELIRFWTKQNPDNNVEESSVPTDIQIFLFGKTAIVTSVIIDTVKSKDSTEVIRSRPFDVWMRSGHGWRWISSRETLITK